MKVNVISLAVTLTSALVAAVPQPDVFSSEENPAQIVRRQTVEDLCKTPCGGVENILNGKINDDGSVTCKCKNADPAPTHGFNSGNPPQPTRVPR
ncbi:hypothetical protein LY76DRAFT_687768 [Colletotrichum caudatum]|nr:hypothetical protein LY76DRAFT_687768 [Colletotrichum caudatum]